MLCSLQMLCSAAIMAPMLLPACLCYSVMYTTCNTTQRVLLQVL
jgi:hypothetical protein